MSKTSLFLQLRLDLDYAITYKSKKEAIRLARVSLKKAEEEKIPGEIVYFKGQIEIIKGNFASAIEYMDEAIKLNPLDGAAYNDRALSMVELGILDEAFFYFDKGIAVEPDYATIYHNKGWLLNNLGMHTEAIKCFNKALELEPDRAVTYDNLANALYNLKDYKGAIESYQKVLLLLKPGESRGIKNQILKQMRLILNEIEAEKSKNNFKISS